MPTDLFAKEATHGLQSSIRGLHATPTAPLPFLNGVVVRSFLLEREAGNVIIYNSPGIAAAAGDILKLGKPTRLLVTHYHEGMYEVPDLNVPIYVHENDRAQTELPVSGSFAGQETIDDDIEVIPASGHTAGTTMFLWDQGEHRLLFPGDSIWVQGGEWKAVLLGESDRNAYLDSLALIMDLDFDFLVPWGAEEGQPYGYGVGGAEARDHIGRIIQRLKAGESA